MKKERSGGEKLWRALLVLLVLIECGLLGGLGYQLYFHEVQFQKYQIGALLFLTVWIYIAYLKQRTADVSKIALDEKIKTHALLASLPYGTLILDAENNFLYANPQAGELLEKDPMLEENPLEIFGSDAKKLLAEDRWGSYELKLYDNSPVNLTLLPIKDSKNEMVGKLLSLQEREISEKVQAEASGVKQVQKNLRLFMEGLERELKSTAPELYEKSRVGLLVIETASEREQLLEQLLSERGHLLKQESPLFFTSLLAEVIEEVKKGYAAHRSLIRLGEVGSFSLPAPACMKYVLKELLLNALLFSPAGSRILIEATVQDGAFRITVTDGGEGIAQDFLPEVFDEGVRTPGGVCDHLRSGRGLYAVKTILDELGVMVRLDTRKGEGTTVVLDGVAEEGKRERK